MSAEGARRKPHCQRTALALSLRLQTPADSLGAQASHNGTDVLWDSVWLLRGDETPSAQ